jgi:hypothetical protein
MRQMLPIYNNNNKDAENENLFYDVLLKYTKTAVKSMCDIHCFNFSRQNVKIVILEMVYKESL